MTIWIVTGLHNSVWVGNVRANYIQRYPDRRLVVVENGAGVGHWAIGGAVVLRSDPGAAPPLNTALAWLRENAAPEDWFCKCDADDYYGPDYLDQVAAAITPAVHYSGRASLYIRTTDHRLWYAQGADVATVFHGPTIAGRIRDALDFPTGTQWGEDEGWGIAMRQAGRRAATIQPEGFCYQRWADYQHTWPCTDHDLRVSWETEFLDLGAMNYDVVNGLLPRPHGIALPHPAAMVPDDLMAVRVLKQNLDPRLLSFLERD